MFFILNTTLSSDFSDETRFEFYRHVTIKRAPRSTNNYSNRKIRTKNTTTAIVTRVSRQTAGQVHSGSKRGFSESRNTFRREPGVNRYCKTDPERFRDGSGQWFVTDRRAGERTERRVDGSQTVNPSYAPSEGEHYTHVTLIKDNPASSSSDKEPCCRAPENNNENGTRAVPNLPQPRRRWTPPTEKHDVLLNDAHMLMCVCTYPVFFFT